MCLTWFRLKKRPVPGAGIRTPRSSTPSTPKGEEAVRPKPDSPSQVKQIPGPLDLPSQVDETLAECPRFRIVLVGNSGVGKSSLIRNIFNIDKIDVQHGRAGHADIEQEYTSIANPRFILHDSKGFEAGDNINYDTVEKFLQTRSKYDLPEKIHAIWLCVETPRTGTRLLQTGNEELLKLANQFKIPIIAVFTKYDRLVTQFCIQDPSGKSKQEKLANAEKEASVSFDSSVKELQGEWASIPCVKVSTNGTNAQQTLIDLTNKTRSKLQGVEGELRVVWVAAQQVNVQQKVEVSISEGFKKYWQDLGHSREFEGKILVDCIHRIHDDVLKVWNFNDPTKILSGTEFFTQMIGLVKPLIDEQVGPTLLPTAPVAVFGSTGATVLMPLLENFGFTHSAIQYLYDKYQKYPSTGRFLATYIINLVLVLHGVFTELLLLSSDPPRVLSNDVVVKVLGGHISDVKKKSFEDIDIADHPEQVIRKRLGLL